MEYLISELGGYIAIIQVLLGGVLTFVGGIVGNQFLQKRQRRNERENLSSTFRGEIGAILLIIESRGYQKRLEDRLKRIKDGERAKFTTPIRRKYTLVYENNVGKLGVLDSPLPEAIVTFYMQINALLDDNQTLDETKIDDIDLKYLEEKHEDMIKLLAETLKLGYGILEMLGTEKTLKHYLELNKESLPETSKYNDRFLKS
jgi:hypothetical protein